MASSLKRLNGQGLNLSNIDETTPEEISTYLSMRWRGRGPLYDQYAMSLMLDYAPDFAKLTGGRQRCFARYRPLRMCTTPSLPRPIRSSNCTATWSWVGRPGSATSFGCCADLASPARK